MEEFKTVKISALQMHSEISEVDKNISKVKYLTEKELPGKTDFLVLPEVWTVGWSCEDFTQSAEHICESKTVKFLSELAKKFNMNILGGSFIEKRDNGKFYNTSPVINRAGELVTTYSKTHLYSYCGCTEGDFVTVGESPVMVELDGVKIGLTICYDIRFPEIFREYRKKGAELLVNMAAWGLKKPVPWQALTCARAVENQTYTVALTQSGPIKGEDWNIGHSRIFDYVGNTIAEIKDQKEGFMSCEINFKDMYDYRNSCTILKDIRDNYEVKTV